MAARNLLKWSPYLTVLLIFSVLFLGFDFNGLYGQDAHEYLRFGKALRVSWENGTDPGPFQWPKLYPFLGAILSYTGISVVFAMQLISLAACLGGGFYAKKLIQTLYGTDGSLFLLLGAATQVYFVRSGFFVMSDALCAFFVIATTYYAVRTDRTREWNHFLLMLLFAAGAMFTRYASLPLIFVLCGFGTYRFLSQLKISLQLLVYLVLAGMVGVVLWFNNREATEIVHITRQWSIRNLFVFERMNGSRLETTTVPNGVYIWSNFAHFGYLSFGILLLVWLKKWNWKTKFLWVALLLYLVFLAGLEVQNQRFLVITHLIVLALIFPAFELLKATLSQRKLWIPFIAGVLVFNGSFFYYSFSKLYGMHRFEKQIVQELQPLEDDKIIYSFSVNQSFASYDLPNPSVNLWYDSIAIYPGNYVVFNPEQFQKEWAQSSVMFNWKRMNDEFDLEVVKELPQHWNLYRINE